MSDNNPLKYNGINLGDGKMEYIENINEQVMMRNAWHAITETNSWDFVRQDIESFMFSKNKQINIISEKMEDLGYKEHSGTSFGCTMRKMQYLAQNGEEEFKKLYLKSNTNQCEFIKNNKFIEYTGGF